MSTALIERIRTRYGRLILAIALLAGGVVVGLSAEPRGVTATERIVVVNDPTTERTAPEVHPFTSVLRFDEVCVIYTHYPTLERTCWTVHDLDGNVLGIYADRAALETFFPEVETDELLYAALSNSRAGNDLD